MTTVTPAEALIVDAVVYTPLKPADRSDAISSAQALVRIFKGKQDLLLDGHSYHKHEADLVADGWAIYEDIREIAENKPVAAY